MKKIVIGLVGLVSVALGLFGLIVPLIPGVLFLLIAAVCFATLSPRLQRRLRSNPRLRRLFDRVEQGGQLGSWPRIKLMLWAVAEAATPSRRR